MMNRISKMFEKYTHLFMVSDPENIRGLVDESIIDIGELLELDRICIFEINYLSNKVSSTHEWTDIGIEAKTKAFTDVSFNQMPWLIEKIRNSEVVHFKSTKELPLEAQVDIDFLKNNFVNSLMVLPLFTDSKVIGFLWLESIKNIGLFSDEVFLIRMIAEMFSISLERLYKSKELLKFKYLYEAAFENSIAANIIFDKDNQVVKVNKQFEYLTGHKLIEPHASDNLPITISELFKDPRHRYFDNEFIETKLNKKSGEVIPVYSHMKEISYENHKMISLIDISNLKTLEENLEVSYERLRSTFISTIHALGRVVEISDPYTSNHQKRVADLARLIARNMGLGKEIVENIYLSGLLHDVGKIYVPAQILNKPSKLNPVETEMIKMHAAFSNEIVGTIEFPWPIAEIVYQHHEKLNGSGYPNGLKRNEIRIEAQILAVADIVEAISSHRPYRPSYGIDYAVDTIKTQSDIELNKDAVFECVDIIKKKQWQ